MEMSRQRMRPSLGDSTQITCPRCKGQGSIRNVESVALSVLRLLEEEAMKKGTEKVIAHLSIECATFLLNEKRSVIESIEHRLKVGIVILPSKHLETPAYDIERIREKESGADDKPSYVQIKAEDIAIPEFAQQVKPKSERAVIKEFLHDSPAPAPVQNKNESASLIKRFWHKLVGSKPEKINESEVQSPKSSSIAEENRQSRSRNNNRRGQSSKKETGDNRVARSQQQPRNNRPPRVQEQRATNPQEPRPQQNRQQDPNRNNRRDVTPPPVDEINKVLVVGAEQFTPVFLPNVEVEADKTVTANLDETSGSNGDEKPRPGNKRNGSRRGPNRRRPRNPNYKKPESAGGDEDRSEGSSGGAGW